MAFFTNDYTTTAAPTSVIIDDYSKDKHKKKKKKHSKKKHSKKKEVPRFDPSKQCLFHPKSENCKCKRGKKHRKILNMFGIQLSVKPRDKKHKKKKNKKEYLVKETYIPQTEI